MQTFLPYASFEKTAKCLDYRRLGKQRVEAFQILTVLLKLKENPNTKVAWMNHPAVLMWKGCEHFLRSYGVAMCVEWKRRGYKDTMEERFLKLGGKTSGSAMTYPSWYNSKSFHQSHRSNLLRKNPEHYRKFWPKLTNSMEYVWPVRNSPIKPF